MSKTKRKPKKPCPDYPLTAHRNGQWCKKIRGKLWYFGRWGDPEAALQEYLRIRDDLQAGRTPTTKAVVVTLADVCNEYLGQAKSRRDAGDISPRTWQDYRDVCKLLTVTLGRTVAAEQLGPADFSRFRSAVAARYAPSRLSKTITVSRMVFKWAYESDVIDRMPKFGPDFKGASKRAVREQKARMGGKMFSAAEVRTLLEKADMTLRAMILLGVNGGMGNNDIASLPLSAVDINKGWINYPRPKTGVDRRFPLWPETAAALRAVIDKRPNPKSDDVADRVFLTGRGGSWISIRESDGRRVDQIVLRFRKLMKDAGCYRRQCGFYNLRHVHQTVVDDAGDPIATAHVMGHADGTIGGVYRERISDDRLRKVTDHVRQWLFGAAESKPARRGLRTVG